MNTDTNYPQLSIAQLPRVLTGLLLALFIAALGQTILVTAMPAIVADLFPPAESGKYQGLIAGVYGVAAIIAPVLGGFITDNFSWRWIFFLNVPIGILSLATLRSYPTIKSNTEKKCLDYAGMITLILAVVPTLLALSWGGVQYDWTSGLVLACLTLGLLMTVLFVLIELKSTAPILPLSMYRDRVVAVSAVCTFAAGFVIYSSILFVPLFSQGATGASATSSG